MQPAGEHWVKESDGRDICLACLNSIVVDTPECQPLYDNILAFYQHMGMPLPERPPLMLVEGSALNEAENKEGRHTADNQKAPVFHTRGLTLTVEYRSIRHVARAPHKGHRNPFKGLQQQQADVSSRAKCEVTAILVLHGLPYLLTGTILAHECMHAWLRLHGVTGLSLDVEEGLCQLLGLLWLENQDLSKHQGAWEERLASYFAHQIRTDPSVVYGDGFRAAHDAFQMHGLKATLQHVVQTGTLP
jgi:hypothetical protein